MITTQDIPVEWRDLLYQVQTVDPKAIIGGGCLRDLDRERQLNELAGTPVHITPKDIDVFVHDQLYEIRHVLTATYGRFESETVTAEESAAADTTVAEQQHWNIPRLPQINILRCDFAILPIERFARFDYGLCQVIFDGQRLMFTDAYMTDREDKTFTLLRYTNGFAHKNSLERFERFQSRPEYSGHKLIIPEALIPDCEESELP